MSRIAIPTLAGAPAETQATLEAVTRRLGWTPNLFRLMALSPNTLAAFVGLSGSLELELNRRSESCDPKRAAAVRFARAIAGVTAQFLFTNFMSNIAQVELDFPAG